MRSYRIILPTTFFCLKILTSFAQCPTILQLQSGAGGTFSGDCALNVGANITINGIVNWSSGTLAINGSAGSIIVSNGATLNVHSGEINAIDGGTGVITINNGGTINVSAGATLIAASNIIVNGTLSNSGTAQSQAGRLEVGSSASATITSSGTLTTSGSVSTTIQGSLIVEGNYTSASRVNVGATGNVTISSTGMLTTTGGGPFQIDGSLTIAGTFTATNARLVVASTGTVTITSTGTLTTTSTNDNVIQGTLAVAGTFNASGDLEINGGDVTIQDDGSLHVTGTDGDLFVYGNGSLTIEQGGEVSVNDDFSNVDDDAGGPSGGIINIAGQLSVVGDLGIANTTPNSQLLGTASGQITVTGSVSDAECPTYNTGVYTFCDCTGGGETCSAVLPVELVSFTAAHQQGNVLLEWSTASEFNNSHFTVERFNDVDQIISLIDIPGKGTTTDVNHYRFIDSTPQAGDNYYRLKQVDFNGAIAYSAVVKTEVTFTSPQITLSINPAEQELLYINASGLKPNIRIPISVVAANGSTYFFGYETTNETGDLLNEIDTSTLTPGLYIIKVAALHTKFVK